MVTFARILCAVDLSDGSRRALLYALGLARACQAIVRVVHVADLQRWLGTRAGEFDAAAGETLARLEEQLGWWVARSLGAGDGAATEVREGAVVAGTLEAAMLMPADLIVLGSHGRGGFERLGPGSVAERVVHQAPVPVMVVPARPGAVVRTGAPGRVVCAIDIARPLLRAISYAQFVAEGSPVPLSLLTIIDWPSATTTGADTLAALALEIDDRAAESLHRLAAAAGSGAPVNVAVRHGSGGREILAYAREVSAELIVLGASAFAPPGSTIHHILREVHCPVLIVPEALDAHGD